MLFQSSLTLAILEKVHKVFPDFYINCLGKFKQVAHFSVGIQGLQSVKTYLPKIPAAFYLSQLDFLLTWL